MLVKRSRLKVVFMNAGVDQQPPPSTVSALLSIIIPVFNEDSSIAQVVETVFTAPTGRYQKEVIIIDDSSTDGSHHILQTLNKKYPFILVDHAENCGKGAAIRTGLARARGELVLIQDADNEYQPSDWQQMLDLIDGENMDVVYGSRFMGGGNGWHPFNWIANRFLSLLASVLFGEKITDVETCYKLFRRELIDVDYLTENRFGIDIELTAHLLKDTVRFQEVPIKYNARTKSEGKKIGWIDGFVACWALVKYRLKYS